MKPSLDDLYLFSEIANSGGLIRGAKRLGLPKSTVSRRLSKLEREVGAKLIDRDARHFSLTETGIEFSVYAQRMVEAYAEAQDFLAQRDAKPSGVLKVAMPTDFAVLFLAKAIASFAKMHPNLRLEIDASPQIVDLITGRFDLAIRTGKLPDSSLVAKPLTSLQRHFFASKEFLKMHGSPKTLDELAAVPFITLQTQNQSLHSIPLGNGSIQFRPHNMIKTSSIGLTRALAIEGAGVVVLPDAMACAPLVRILQDFEPTPTEVHFILAQRKLTPTKTRVFIDHLQAYCATQ